MVNYRGKNSSQQAIALERITKLFKEAEDSFSAHPELSKRYVALAQKLSTRYKVRLTKVQKHSFCKNCNAYLKSGINKRTRIVRGKRIETCLECGNIRRLSL